MTNVTLEGLTHTCDDPDCHVAGFVTTLGRMLTARPLAIRLAAVEVLCDEAESPLLHSMIPLGCVRASEVRAALSPDS